MQYYRDHGILEAAECLWSHLAVADDDPDVLLVVTGWLDRAQMGRWYADPRRAASGGGLAQWIAAAEDVAAAGYDVVHSAHGGDDRGQ